MPSSFLTRSPRSAAPIAQPQDDEEDGQRVGTTGGMTVQQAGTWDAPKPTFSADPGVRRTQLADQANADFAAKQRADNPFIFSNDVKTLPQAGATRELGQAVAQGEHDYQEREQVVRQQASDATAAFNSKAEAQFRSRGQQFYTDPETRRLTPVVDEQGRALYHETPWETTTHPKTGTPVMGKRDRFGQPQFKELPIVPGEDATDEKMYYKTPEGDITSAGNISDLLAHPNYNVRRQAMAANTRRQKAVVQQTLGPLKELSDAATTDFQSAQNERDGLTQQVQQANQLAEESVGNDAQSQAYRATAQQLQSRLDGLNQSLNPKGELYTRRGEAARNYSIGRRQSVLNVYQAQDMEMAARLKAEGKDPASDPAYQANHQMLQNVQSSLQEVQPQQQAQAPAAAAPLLESTEPYALMQQGQKGIGGVSLQQMAQRFGSGQGEVAPDSLLRINDRLNGIDATLNSPDTKISGKLRQSLQQQRDYLGNLYDQRFGRLSTDDQGRVKTAVDAANKQNGRGTAAQFGSEALKEGEKPTIGAGGTEGTVATIPKIPEMPPGAMAGLVPEDVAAGLGNVLGRAASGLSSKSNLALMLGTAGAGKIVQRLLSTGFGVKMLYDAKEQAPGVWKTINDPQASTQQKTEAVGDFLVNLVMGTAAAKHGIMPKGGGVPRLSKAQAEAAFQELAEKAKATPAAEPPVIPQTTAEQINQQIPGVPRSAEDVAGIFERNPPQAQEPTSVSSARESAAAILEGQARQEAAANAAKGEVPLDQAPVPAELAAQADARSTARAERIAQAQAGGPAPELSEPTGRTQQQLTSDRAGYDAINARMQQLRDAGGIEAVSSPEYQQLWAQSETIKNRNGGYVTEPAATEQAYDQHGIPQMKPGDARLDKSVKIEATRARTGEKVTVEMPAKKAIERMKARSELFEKLRKCIEG